jgi:hypothetical protein
MISYKYILNNSWEFGHLTVGRDHLHDCDPDFEKPSV